MKEKDIKKEVKLLAKQGYFDDIYQQFGLKYFRNYVSRNYKRKDIRKLEKEGKYFDILPEKLKFKELTEDALDRQGAAEFLKLLAQGEEHIR